MQFTIPQFIDHKAKVVGPLTLKQFAYIGVPGGIIFIMYFTLAKSNLLLFLMISMILLAGGVSLAFIKVNEKSLPQVLSSIILFSLRPKAYLWKRKENPIKMMKMGARPKEKKIEENEDPKLKLVEKGRLNSLSKELGIK